MGVSYIFVCCECKLQFLQRANFSYLFPDRHFQQLPRQSKRFNGK